MDSIAIVLLSGGVDSATALYLALARHGNVLALTYNYPSRPRKEREAAIGIAARAGVRIVEVELPFLQTASEVLRDHASAFSGLMVPEGYIPARNLIYYGLAAYQAEINGADFIVGGHVKTDGEDFPDATREFFESLENLVNRTSLEKEKGGHRVVRFTLPFLEKTKIDVVRLAVQLKVPLELTWSCWNNGEEQCSKCVTCLEREEAFRQVKLADPSKLRP